MSGADEDLLYELLNRWEEAHDRGAEPDPGELCRHRPDLLPELSRRIDDLLLVKRLEDPEPENDPDSPPDIPGGRYVITGRIGQGTEGVVWRAHDSRLDRDVALKVSRRRGGNLLEEAKLVASLQHTHIIKVLDAGHDARGVPFTVTELMLGRTLADRIRDGDGRRIPVVDSIRWVAQIASALRAVHLAGRAHRDVKPVNILLDEHDNAILADFGIAIDMAEQEPGGSTGTPAYKSPEQLAGERLDVRSDVYSLGLVAHELLAGCLPFTNLDDAALVEREIASGVDMRVSRRVPGLLRPVVTRALARHRALRHESAWQFASALKQAWGRRWINRGLTAAALAALATIAALGLAGWRLRAQARQAGRAADHQVEEAMEAAREGMRLQDEMMLKVNEFRDIGDRIIEETTNDPFHRARRAENEARRAQRHDDER